MARLVRVPSRSLLGISCQESEDHAESTLNLSAEPAEQVQVSYSLLKIEEKNFDDQSDTKREALSNALNYLKLSQIKSEDVIVESTLKIEVTNPGESNEATAERVDQEGSSFLHIRDECVSPNTQKFYELFKEPVLDELTSVYDTYYLRNDPKIQVNKIIIDASSGDGLISNEMSSEDVIVDEFNISKNEYSEKSHTIETQTQK